MLVSYFEELRLATIKVNDLFKKVKANQNNSNSKNTTNNSTKYNLFDIFNEHEMLNLNMQFRYIIQPAYEMMLASLSANINSYLTNFNTIYIAIFTIFIVFLFILYILVWRPFEHNLNQTVILNFLI